LLFPFEQYNSLNFDDHCLMQFPILLGRF